MHGGSAPSSAARQGGGRPIVSETLFNDPELLRRFGITRVGDITDLDVIGVPVWFAVRPNSRGLSVAQGKGLTVRQARLSAVMEAIEGAVAEDVQRHVKHHGSWRQLRERGMPLVSFDTLARVDCNAFDPERERAWVSGYSVRTGEEVLAPYELIGMDFRADFPWDRQAFHMGSQGLAAGFDFDRTVLHALLELVENDACFTVDAFETRRLALRPFLAQPKANRPLDELLVRLAGLGIKPRLFDLTGANGVPVVMASLQRSIVAMDGPGERAAGGVACRLDPDEAALAALLEAIQSRLTDISGARDDLAATRYDADRSAARGTAPPAVHSRAAIPATPVIATGYAAPAWRQLADHLFTSGVDDICIFPLESDTPGITVVRVLANGLAVAGNGMNTFSLGALDAFLHS